MQWLLDRVWAALISTHMYDIFSTYTHVPGSVSIHNLRTSLRGAFSSMYWFILHISPLFWYEAWEEDDILPPPGVRMGSVAVYRRMGPGGGEAESSFYVPTSSAVGPQTWKSDASSAIGLVSRFDDEKTGQSMQLPAGDAKRMARERREKAKAMERLGEIEQREERDWEEGKARWMEEMINQGLDD